MKARDMACPNKHMNGMKGSLMFEQKYPSLIIVFSKEL